MKKYITHNRIRASLMLPCAPDRHASYKSPIFLVKRITAPLKCPHASCVHTHTHTHAHTHVFGRQALHSEGGKNCRACGGPQPTFAYHCPTCDQCVLFMDHHCPFTANCVGQDNFRYFFGFIFWSWMAASYAVWLTYHPHGHCEITEAGRVCGKANVKAGLLFASIAFCVVLTIFLVRQRTCTCIFHRLRGRFSHCLAVCCRPPGCLSASKLVCQLPCSFV